MTQKQRLVKMFKEQGTISNYQLRSMQPPMFDYITRIWELEQKGYVFKKGFLDPNDPKKYTYKLIAEPTTARIRLENGQYMFA